jgi:hypothetical protein
MNFKGSNWKSRLKIENQMIKVHNFKKEEGGKERPQLGDPWRNLMLGNK